MVLSRAHMPMVIFPYIFNIFHMSGVKKNVKNKKKISELRLVDAFFINNMRAASAAVAATCGVGEP